jgi:Ca2+-binding EF-hand superfamily protein
MLDKDDFAGWFFDTYSEDPNGIISVKDLYKIFKDSDYYCSISSGEKKSSNTEGKFKQMIKDKMKHIFVASNSMVNGVRVTKDSVKGYTLKIEEDDFECE